MRIYDPAKAQEVIDYMFRDGGDRVDGAKWVANPDNIMLENEVGDIVMCEFAFVGKRLYSTHYYFKSKGRKAIKSARNFLDELFNTCYNIDVVMGLTPLTNKAARWFNRQIGCTSHGFDEIHGNHYELFIITKKEFNGG